MATPYFPRADGVFVTLPPGQLSLKAEAADVPFIIGTSIPASSVRSFDRVHGSSGDVKDEGTLFSLGSLNITYASPFHGYPGTNVRMLTHTHRTDDEVASYISETWFPGSSVADLNKTLELYPSDPAAGSPFDTGNANAFTPEYKRIVAIQGDWFFNGPRRQFLDAFSAKRTAYNFCASSLSRKYRILADLSSSERPWQLLRRRRRELFASPTLFPYTDALSTSYRHIPRIS